MKKERTTMKIRDFKKIVSELMKLKVQKIGLPAVECFIVQEGKLIATNLHTWLTFNVPFQNGTMISIQIVNNIIINLSPNETIGFEQKSQKINVIINDIVMFSFESTSILDFPTNPNNNMTLIGYLSENDIVVIKKISTFRSKDELRLEMNGLFIDNENIVATSGLVLSKIKHDNEYKINNKYKGLVLTKDVYNLVPVDEYEFFYSTTHAIFVSENETIMIELYEKNFPDYKSVFPEKEKISYSYNRKELKKQLALAAVASSSLTRVVIQFSKMTKIMSEDIDYGHSFTNTIKTIIIENKNTSKPEMEIGFNIKLLLLCLNQNKDCIVKFSINSPTKAVIIDEESLLMPIQMDNLHLL